MVIYVECGLLYYAYYNAVIFFYIPWYWCMFCFLGLVYGGFIYGVFFFVLLGWFMCCMWLYYAYYNAVTLYSLVVVYVFGFFLGGVGGFRVAFACCHGLCILYMRILYILYMSIVLYLLERTINHSCMYY